MAVDEVVVCRLEDEILETLDKLSRLPDASLSISMLESKYIIHVNRLGDLEHQKEALNCRKLIYALRNTYQNARLLMDSYVAYQGVCGITDNILAKTNYSAAFILGANTLLDAGHASSSPLDAVQKGNLIRQLEIIIQELYRSLQFMRLSKVTKLCYELCLNLKDLLCRDAIVQLSMIRKAVTNIGEAIQVVNAYHSTEIDVSLCKSLAVIWLRFCLNQRVLNQSQFQINFYGVINNESQYKKFFKQSLANLLQVPTLKNMIMRHPGMRNGLFALAVMQKKLHAANLTIQEQANEICILQAQLLQQSSSLEQDDITPLSASGSSGNKHSRTEEKSEMKYKSARH